MRFAVILAAAGLVILAVSPAAAQEVYLINGIKGTVTWSLDGGALVTTSKGKRAIVPLTPGVHKLTMNAPPAPGQSYAIGISMDEEFKAADLAVQGDRSFWCVTAVVFMNIPMAIQASPEDCARFTKDLAAP